MCAWIDGWAKCRDAEFAGEEAMHDAFNSSDTLAVCLKLEHDAAPAAQPDPDDEAPECNVCGKPVAYGERHYRCGSAVMPAAQPGVQPVADWQWRSRLSANNKWTPWSRCTKEDVDRVAGLENFEARALYAAPLAVPEEGMKNGAN